jgi:polyhydroxyalkanoate synthase subunit PhaC
MADESSREMAEHAAGVLGPESDLFEDMDSAGFADALSKALQSSLSNPALPARASLQLATDLAQIPWVAATRWFGREIDTPVPVNPKDRRFADPAWSTNPWFYGMRLAYLSSCRFARDVVTAAALDDDVARKAELALNLTLDALSPTNFFPLNPAALKKAFDTGGSSVVKGWLTFLDDLVNNDGKPRQVDTSGFEVGRNLACSPGKVVFRNELMELIQYAPQTEKVHARPLLCSPPWINKYYVMDLAPGRSFIEWAVRHGRTVFAISYLNPSQDMADTTMDDYLVHGPQKALDVVQDITGAETIDIVGLCLGGALTAITAAYLTQGNDSRVGTLTLLNTMLDYAEPGVLANFTDERTVERLIKKIARSGTLEGTSMAGTFDVLRANDLIFSYVVSNWLMGKQPPAFDILAWNADSTRLPAAMHSFYMRSLYAQNQLAKGVMELAGQVLSLANVKSDTYIVGAVNDHIVPWPGSYKSTRLLGGTVRFVLSSGGHIAGIVNPPGPKAWYEAGEHSPADPARWRKAAERHDGSWWEDWTSWADARAGRLVAPPAMGSDRYPALGEAPGEYVRG